jgi:hypothetical protein
MPYFIFYPCLLIILMFCRKCASTACNLLTYLFEVSEVQGTAGNSEKPGGKTTESTAASSGTFPGSQQPYNHLGWNADISGSTKEKQEQVPPILILSISAMCIVH